MSQRCVTCAHWSAPTEPWQEYGHCRNDKLQGDSADYPPDGLAGGEPAEYTGITTGPQFGCIHHAQPTPADPL